MDSQTHHFHNLDTVIDQVHSLFDTWEKRSTLSDEADLNLLYQLKLAVHEWLANLVQHANFETEVTQVSLTVEPKDEHIACVIEDNSDGFVLDAHLNVEPEYLDSLPERGIGLLILKICSYDLSYQRSEYGGHNRLQFFVSADQNTWTGTQF